MLFSFAVRVIFIAKIAQTAPRTPLISNTLLVGGCWTCLYQFMPQLFGPKAQTSFFFSFYSWHVCAPIFVVLQLVVGPPCPGLHCTLHQGLHLILLLEPIHLFLVRSFYYQINQWFFISLQLGFLDNYIRVLETNQDIIN